MRSGGTGVVIWGLVVCVTQYLSLYIIGAKINAGNWYSSLSGHAFAIEPFTRRSINYVALSKRCFMCFVISKVNCGVVDFKCKTSTGDSNASGNVCATL